MSEPLYRFSYDAMATTFQVVIPGMEHDETYAHQAADAVHQEIQRLEDELSRFRATSDIYRLSQLQAGESTAVGLAAWDCLSLAKAMHQETHGAFDITIGPLMRLWRNDDGSPRQPAEEEIEEARRITGSQHFQLDAELLTVTLDTAPMLFDLGGIGKGYALDQSVQVLQDWGIGSALLNAGDSTLLALGSAPDEAQGWPLHLAGRERVVHVKDRAVSGSGFQAQGAHIIDPRSLDPVPPGEERSYVAAPTAALADALSTAFLVMDQDEVSSLLSNYSEVERF